MVTHTNHDSYKLGIHLQSSQALVWRPHAREWHGAEMVSCMILVFLSVIVHSEKPVAGDDVHFAGELQVRVVWSNIKWLNFLWFQIFKIQK
ncbi:hypothetical protein PRUPE_2G108500 [Prunus persica]|uniref:Uncharacterized protein n=1 Tax=Prunus persica TaxID=3760 RepID=A0A251QFE8_PRUPE|nr:hypothetical protein PRUPE_2G108500 [Prunus persica]